MTDKTMFIVCAFRNNMSAKRRMFKTQRNFPHEKLFVLNFCFLSSVFSLVCLESKLKTTTENSKRTRIVVVAVPLSPPPVVAQPNLTTQTDNNVL